MASLARRHNATLATSGAEAAKNAPHPCFSNTSHFNPRSPCEERRASTGCRYMSLLFQPTLPVRGATSPGRPGGRPAPISTHAPRAGSDHGALPPLGLGVISTHAPRAGSDCAPTGSRVADAGFQSTLPVRGATRCPAHGIAGAPISIHAPRAGSDRRSAPGNPDLANFNPRSPCGERHNATDVRLRDAQISTHAPRAGSDALEVVAGAGAVQFQSTLPVRGATRKGTGQVVYCEFQSTLPVRGATVEPGPGRTCRMISIHAPRAGSDHARRRVLRRRLDFNPRSPCGERPWLFSRLSGRLDFNPRSPCGERLLLAAARGERRVISTHAPRAGSDICPARGTSDRTHFNPRSPCGERRRPPSGSSTRPTFQPTLPVRGATSPSFIFRPFPRSISTHAPRAGIDAAA